MKEKAIKKAQLAFKKYADSAVGKAEKEAIRQTTDKMLKKHGLMMDWKTGKISEATETKKTAGTKKKASTTKKTAKTGMSTADLIAFIAEVYDQEWTGKNLRRRIRQMDKWNDGKTTYYDFTPQDVIEILKHIGYDTKEAEKKLA